MRAPKTMRDVILIEKLKSLDAAYLAAPAGSANAYELMVQREMLLAELNNG